MAHLAMIEGVVRALLFAKGQFNKKYYPYNCFLVHALNLLLVFAANRNAFPISLICSIILKKISVRKKGVFC